MAWQESGCGPHLALAVENNPSVDSKTVEVCIYRVSTALILEEDHTAQGDNQDPGTGTDGMKAQGK